jgi:tyrosinase
LRTDVSINGSNSGATSYVGWAPVPSQVRLSDPTGATGPVAVRLRGRSVGQGGRVVFYPALPGAARPELTLTLPLGGAPVSFLVAGQFGRPSLADRDAAIEVVNAANGQVLSTTPLMVRIRKNANTLSVAERNRFRSAFATLNDRGMGRFSDFRNVHTAAADEEAHGRSGFLPWHRAFLLDLERELQRIDPSVALPYWRFDQPAPRVFSRDFMGFADAVQGTVRFSADNPLQFWATDGVPGIVRPPRFNTQTEAARNNIPNFPVIDELATLDRGGTQFEQFRRMEGTPHGAAHVSFGGSISDVPTAAKDPLFFLLHANVDRLWAKWQWARRRFDASPSTYQFRGSAGSPGATRVGHNRNDTMWPWNQVTGSPRPPTAPGGEFPPSALTGAPGARPTVGALIDYQGVASPASRLGFDYDDVPFQL